MAAQRGLFDPDERYAALSKAGDPLERLAGGIDFELFRPELDATPDRSDGRQGGRRTRRPSGGSGKPWCGPARWRNSSPGSTRILRTPDISPGYLAMGGQLVDATIVAAPRRRMTDAGKEIVKGGGIPPDWQANPRKPAQKDRDARWTLKPGRRKTRPDGPAMGAIATPVFGCKSHIDADRRHGFVRRGDGGQHDRELPRLQPLIGDHHRRAGGEKAEITGGAECENRRIGNIAPRGEQAAVAAENNAPAGWPSSSGRLSLNQIAAQRPTAKA